MFIPSDYNKWIRADSPAVWGVNEKTHVYIHALIPLILSTLKAVGKLRLSNQID